MHPSFAWFLSLKWRKSTFYRSRVPILLQNLTADGLLWRHRHMGQPLVIVTSQWSIVLTGIYGRMMLRSRRVKGILGLTSLFTFLFIFGPPYFNTGIASTYKYQLCIYHQRKLYLILFFATEKPKFSKYSLKFHIVPNCATTRLAWSCKLQCYYDCIALKFDRHLGSIAAEVPVKSYCDWISLNPNPMASRLHEILR